MGFVWIAKIKGLKSIRLQKLLLYRQSEENFKCFKFFIPKLRDQIKRHSFNEIPAPGTRLKPALKAGFRAQTIPGSGVEKNL